MPGGGGIPGGNGGATPENPGGGGGNGIPGLAIMCGGREATPAGTPIGAITPTNKKQMITCPSLV